METFFLTFIGLLLFLESWYILGFYIESRLLGIITLIGTIPLLIGIFLWEILKLEMIGYSILSIPSGTALMLTLVIYFSLWTFYFIASSLTYLWSYNSRLLGFISLIIAFHSLIVFGIPWTYPEQQVSNGAAMFMSISAIVLGIISTMRFFQSAVPFRYITKMTGWFTLFGSVILLLVAQSITLKLFNF
tara:strand:- start:89 stop:655 length:567 start_codon:yes stop_codon:yes gene_type:complete